MLRVHECETCQMNLIILVIILILLFGVGGGGYYGSRYGWGGPHYLGGGVGLIVLILVILFLFGGVSSMSKYQARAALNKLVGRPALVAQSYAGQGISVGTEVTSSSMLADIHDLSNAVVADEAAKDGERRALLASSLRLRRLRC